MEVPRVVIIGMGAITPIGSDLQTISHNLENGVSGIDVITKVPDLSVLEAKIAGEVRDFNPRDYLEFKEARRSDAFTHYAIAAVHKALEDAGIDLRDYDQRRIGIYVGTGIGGFETFSSSSRAYHEKGPRKMEPLTVPKLMPNAAAAGISMHWGLHSPTVTTTEACSAGLAAIEEATRAIWSGRYDLTIAGGTEAAVTDLGIEGFTQPKALTTEYNDPP